MTKEINKLMNKYCKDLERLDKKAKGRVVEMKDLRDRFGEAGGCLPSPEDNRDIPLSAFQESVEIPEVYFTDLTMFGVNYQGKIPSCVAQSVSQIKEEQELRDIGKIIKFSPRFLYALCKKFDGYSGSGTYLRVACKMACEYGVCPDKMGLCDEDISLPLSDYQNYNFIPLGAFQEASAYIAGGYAKADCDMDSIKQAIYQNKTVLLGFEGSNEGWAAGDIRPPKTGEKQWGHAVLGYGYDKDHIYFKNHWAQRWGMKGCGRFTSNYLPFECWTITDVPTQLIINAKNMYKLLRVKGQSKVYACKGAERHWIINPQTLAGGDMDGQWDMKAIIDCSQEELDKYQEGDTFLRFASPDIF